MKKWRVALLGLGRMGRYHLQKLDLDPRFELVLVVDPELQELPKLSQSQPKLARQLTVLAEHSLDCAVVATPTETHFEVVSQLLGMGLHVLVEKPAASSFRECQSLQTMATERGLCLAVGNVERSNPAIAALKAAVSSGVLGVPVHMSTSRAGGYPPRVNQGNHVILDLAVHDLDIVRMFFGPLAVQHAIAHCTRLPGIYDTAEITLASHEGISATVHVNWLSPQRERRVRFIGTEAVCELDYLSQSCKLFGPNLAASAAAQGLHWKVEDQSAQFDVLSVPVVARDALSHQLSEFAAYLQKEAHGLAVGVELSESVMLAEQAVQKLVLTPNLYEVSKPWRPAFEQNPDRVLN